MGGGTIDVGQIFSVAIQPWLSAVVNLLIVAAVGWAATWLRVHCKVNVDEKQRDAITKFVENQAGALLAAGSVRMDGVKLNVDNRALAFLVERAAYRIPEAMAHFGLTPDVIAQKIIEAIPQIPAGAQIVAQAHAAAAAGAAKIAPGHLP